MSWPQPPIAANAARSRWILAKKLPPAIQALLEYCILGLISDPAFHGWHVSDGRLVLPTGVTLTPGMIEGLALIHQRNRWQVLRIRELEARVRLLDDAVEHWRERAGQQRVSNDSII